MLVVWAAPDHGTRSAARALAGTVAAAPHHLEVVEIDLAEALAGVSVLQTIASIVSWSGLRIEPAVVAARGWSAVEQGLRGREVRTVVALDPVVAQAVDSWSAKGLLRCPVVGVLHGLRVDPAWARTAVDRLSVADTVQAEQALALGLSAARIVPCGIPVCGGFSSISPDDKVAHRHRFGIPTQRPVVLTVTEGLDQDQLTGALFQLSMVAEGATLLFDVARDELSADLLRRRASLYGVQARMFGKVEQAAQLWGTADLVVARSHLYVEQRALALRLPYVHLEPDEESARETARIYEERGIGRAVAHLATLAAQIELQLEPSALDRSRHAIGEISKRSACQEVGRLVAQVWADAPQILAERGARESNQEDEAKPRAAAGQDPASPDARADPLELIGVERSPGPDDPAGLATRPEDLEAAEIIANRQVTQHHDELERWSRRAELAREKGDQQLQQAAERQTARAREAMHRALAELARLAERRKEIASQARDGRLERSFRKMEVDEALAALKRKAGREEDPG